MNGYYYNSIRFVNLSRNINGHKILDKKNNTNDFLKEILYKTLFSDARNLGFQFVMEPRRNVTVMESSSHLLECSYVLAHERLVHDVRIEWKRDGVLLSERTSSRM